MPESGEASTMRLVGCLGRIGLGGQGSPSWRLRPRTQCLLGTGFAARDRSSSLSACYYPGMRASVAIATHVENLARSGAARPTCRQHAWALQQAVTAAALFRLHKAV